VAVFDRVLHPISVRQSCLPVRADAALASVGTACANRDPEPIPNEGAVRRFEHTYINYLCFCRIRKYKCLQFQPPGIISIDKTLLMCVSLLFQPDFSGLTVNKKQR
jgi:predicted YcjX-like family ATPase